MILGVALEKNKLLMASYYRREIDAQFSCHEIAADDGQQGSEGGSIWVRVDEKALETAVGAEEVVFAVPSAVSFLKRLDILNSDLVHNPSFLEWAASIHLPGEPSNYHFEFLPLRQSFDLTKIEMLLFAMPRKYYEKSMALLKMDEQSRVRFIPEQLGFVRVLEKSLDKPEFQQGGIVNCSDEGIAAVYARDGRYHHSRFFLSGGARKNDIASDIETYFLSRADIAEPLPLVITGFTGCFATGWSPIVPAFLGIHDLEYAAAWGVADFALQTQ
jgi:hypothetical protein